MNTKIVVPYLLNFMGAAVLPRRFSLRAQSRTRLFGPNRRHNASILGLPTLPFCLGHPFYASGGEFRVMVRATVIFNNVPTTTTTTTTVPGERRA